MKYFIFYELFNIGFMTLCTIVTAIYWIIKFTKYDISLQRRFSHRNYYKSDFDNFKIFIKKRTCFVFDGFKTWLLVYIHHYLPNWGKKLSERIIFIVFIIFELILYPIDWLIILAHACQYRFESDYTKYNMKQTMSLK